LLGAAAALGLRLEGSASIAGGAWSASEARSKRLGTTTGSSSSLPAGIVRRFAAGHAGTERRAERHPYQGKARAHRRRSPGPGPLGIGAPFAARSGCAHRFCVAAGGHTQQAPAIIPMCRAALRAGRQGCAGPHGFFLSAQLPRVRARRMSYRHAGRRKTVSRRSIRWRAWQRSSRACFANQVAWPRG